eukprot:8601167-Prorocentrum_lima.AAC.1
MAATWQALGPLGITFAISCDLGGGKRTWRVRGDGLDHRFPRDGGQFRQCTSCLMATMSDVLQAAA